MASLGDNPGTARRTTAAALRDLRRVWPRTLVTDIVHKLVAFALLATLAGLVLRIFPASLKIWPAL
jgi:hypothetical protein